MEEVLPLGELSDFEKVRLCHHIHPAQATAHSKPPAVLRANRCSPHVIVQAGLEAMKDLLQKNIKAGEDFAARA